GTGFVVVIKHGEFFSVYNGLASVNVRKDQQITTKQVIGTIGPNYEGSHVLNFQIWKVGKNNQSAKLDPAGWIAR
ncbi:MAG TPA: M23 family metallopeptidase, partial [Flavipsychrobacter sp.]|nr:M23 family metallopeptidase [Flavipsychrobacter sp.]